MSSGLFPARARSGATMIYMIVTLLALFAIISLGVDWGRVQVAQAQLQTTADAAARYAIVGLKNDNGSGSAAKANAASVVTQNKIDGVSGQIDTAQDVQIGIWNKDTKSFATTNNLDAANAVRVTLHRSTARNNPIPLTFAPLIGRNNASIRASSTAVMDFSLFGNAANSGAGHGTFKYFVPATSNPWLSGMPSGSVANAGNPAGNPDYAGSEFVDDGSGKSRNKGSSGSGSAGGSGASGGNWSTWGDYSAKKGSPIKAGNIPVLPGSTMTFDGVNGGANNSNSTTLYDGDGNTGWVIDNFGKSENGMSNIKAPINSVIAVFLTDTRPDQNNSSKNPPVLDFSSASSRNFTSLEPQIQQVFFIGNGRRDNGEVQRFKVPAGATRLFIGTMDGWEWNNNVGGFEVTAHLSGNIVTVQ
ncbi:MAG TPA: pilus assembly protein [Tepidisphaeraceae bacterium]|nr:pilus assembly protein [Tepidisphaeraceae bacterium]